MQWQLRCITHGKDSILMPHGSLDPQQMLSAASAESCTIIPPIADPASQY